MTRYRTLIKGTLVQQSPWTGGGTQGDPAAQDATIARDGKGRLTMTGSSLAGALIATAGRVVPHSWDRDPHWRWISGKTSDGTSGGGSMRQSVWRFHASHPDATGLRLPETRDGVGIRQKTGATATEKNAKYDVEVLPKGAKWPVFLEIDTELGGEKALALALKALDEWRHGRCWLGASAVRGLGQMKLENITVLHLPLEPDFINTWPDSSRGRDQIWNDLVAQGAREQSFDQALLASSNTTISDPNEEPWQYMELSFRIVAGQQNDGYGWNSLSTGGSPWLVFDPPVDRLIVPPGMDKVAWEKLARSQDHPVLATSGKQNASALPIVAGSSLRGTMRHTVSRLARQNGIHVDDPLDPGLDKKHKPAPSDAAASVFGWMDVDSSLLVSDAHPDQSASLKLALLTMHAEDEFTAGAHASSLHNRTCVLNGSFEFTMILEARDAASLKDTLANLMPGLKAAESGFVPIGGGVWRGHGWIPWKLDKVREATAGAGDWREIPNATLTTLTN